MAGRLIGTRVHGGIARDGLLGTHGMIACSVLTVRTDVDDVAAGSVSLVPLVCTTLGYGTIKLR